MKAEQILELVENELYNPLKNYEEVIRKVKELIPGIKTAQVEDLISDILDMNDEESARAEVMAEAGYL